MEKTQSKLSGEFDWKSPETIRASLFGGDNAEAIHEEVSQRYKVNHLVIGAVNYNKKSGIIEGSHPRYIIALNEVFRANNIPVRTANLRDLGIITETGIIDLRGTYEDPALVLRSEGNPNQYLAQHLAKQLRARSIEFSHQNPALIYLGDLELMADDEVGLAFKLRDEAQVINAPQLAQDCRFLTTDKNGVPIADKKGGRELYTINSGVSRLVQFGDLGLISNWNYLEGSGANGRVVVVSEAGAKNFLAQREAELKKTYESQKSELDGRFKTALSILKGN